jgi:hypothetical protein
MNKKVLSDLEKMNKDRARAEQEFMKEKEEVTEIFRIMREGIKNSDELLIYLAGCIKDAKHMEDIARASNNNIMYSEAVAIRREMSKIGKLLSIGGQQVSEVDGTEEAHRANNGGEEAYQ